MDVPIVSAFWQFKSKSSHNLQHNLPDAPGPTPPPHDNLDLIRSENSKSGQGFSDRA